MGAAGGLIYDRKNNCQRCLIGDWFHYRFFVYRKYMNGPPWLGENIKRLVGMIARDERMGRLKPIEIRMSPQALKALIEFLKSQDAYHPNLLKPHSDIKCHVLGVPVLEIKNMPPYTFVAVKAEGLKLIK